MKILLLGADGQVGYELHRAFSPLGQVLPYTYNGQLPGNMRCGRSTSKRSAPGQAGP
jgi:dTDP-4-dehydrorhamnose reductase